jgi:hypothetical protein
MAKTTALLPFSSSTRRRPRRSRTFLFFQRRHGGCSLGGRGRATVRWWFASATNVDDDPTGSDPHDDNDADDGCSSFITPHPHRGRSRSIASCSKEPSHHDNYNHHHHRRGPIIKKSKLYHARTNELSATKPRRADDAEEQARPNAATERSNHLGRQKSPHGLAISDSDALSTTWSAPSHDLRWFGSHRDDYVRLGLVQNG